MISDATTFFLAFAALFIALGIYLWLLDGRTRMLEDRVAGMEADMTSAKDKTGDPEADA